MILKNRFHSQEVINGSETKVPYILADAGEIFQFLTGELQPKVVFAKGYYGQCDKSVIIPADEEGKEVGGQFPIDLEYETDLNC